MARALVIYATRAGETRNIANYVAEGIRMGGQEAEVKDIAQLKAVEDLAGYDAYVLGSATYHGEMMPAMKTLLFLAEKAGLAGKAGGAFGAFGWSGEAPDRIYDTMKNIFAMKMVKEALRLKSCNLTGGVQMAQGYGREVASQMG